jgi:hypothetical protein
VTQSSPSPGLSLIATRLLLGTGAWVDEAVDVACELLAQDQETPATVAVAALSPGTALRDAEPLLRAMLVEQGVPAPPVQPTEAERFEYVSMAFGLGVLPFHEYYGELYGNIPEWSRQSPLQQRVVRLLDDWETETTPSKCDAIVERVRQVVAANEP